MLQNGEKVLGKKNESSEFVQAGKFVGMTESGEYLCENKGQFSRYKMCRPLSQKKKIPMDFEEVCQLLSWGTVFKHIPSGVICKNPVISILSDETVLIDGRMVQDMLWAIPEDAKQCKWSRCEVEHD